jgi:ribosome-associated toxin RatA of RatAB toxin-antitoxin module
MVYHGPEAVRSRLGGHVRERRRRRARRYLPIVERHSSHDRRDEQLSIAGSSSVEIEAPLGVVYAIVSDVEGYVTWQPGLDAATVLERDRWGRQSLVRIEMTRGGKRLHSELRFDYERDVRVSWEQERGDASRFSGMWRLERARRGVVLATYRVNLDLGRVGGLMLRGRLASRLSERFIDPMPLRLHDHVRACHSS